MYLLGGTTGLRAQRSWGEQIRSLRLLSCAHHTANDAQLYYQKKEGLIFPQAREPVTTMTR